MPIKEKKHKETGKKLPNKKRKTSWKVPERNMNDYVKKQTTLNNLLYKLVNMSTLSYTPRPWTICSYRRDGIMNYMIYPGAELEEQALANEKLMKVAPDMYEAIQYAITALADTGGMVDNGELITNADKARKRLMKAIKPLI